MVEDTAEDAQRRGELIAKIVALGLKQPNPEAWVRTFTINALRALTADKETSLIAKGDARRQIHDLARLVSNGIRAERMKLPVPYKSKEKTLGSIETKNVA